MKTAVSVPDELFAQVDRFAKRAGRSRSEVYSAALLEYVERHEPDKVTDALDRVVARLGGSDPADAFTEASARQVLDAAEW